MADKKTVIVAGASRGIREENIPFNTVAPGPV